MHTITMPKERIHWRHVWRLIQPYWVSEEKWKARGLLLAIVALALGMVYLEVLFNAWNRDFYNALETKNYPVFKEQLWRFSCLAFSLIAVAVYRIYLTQSLQMRWRTWMTRQYMARWLKHQAYYRIEQKQSADNPDQRIAEDLNLLCSGALSLSLGLLSCSDAVVLRRHSVVCQRADFIHVVFAGNHDSRLHGLVCDCLCSSRFAGGWLGGSTVGGEEFYAAAL